MKNNLDLHGVRYEDVQQLVDNHLWNAMKKKEDRVFIITGNSDAMKRIVSDVVKEYGYIVAESLSNSAELIIEL